MYLELDCKPADQTAAIDAHGRLVTYGGLVRYISDFRNFVAERTMVIILCRNDVPTLEVCMACMGNRIVPLLIGEKTEASIVQNLMETYHPTHVFGYRMALEKLSLGNCVELVKEADFCMAKTPYEAYPMYEDLSLLLTTSGSTGSPKLVRHSYSNLQEQAKNVSSFFEISSTDRPMVDLPIMYTMGLSIINSHLYAGATLLISDESLISKHFWEFFREYGATSFTGVPYSFELLKRLRFLEMDLPSLRMISQGGGKLPRKLQLEFAGHIISRGGKYIATYGQTECSARMAFLPSELAMKKCGSIGNAIPNGKLYLKDENGIVITAPNTEGEMYYEGPNVTLGYAECGPDLIKGDERHGVIATGDLAYFDEDGYFYITGRIKRFLKLFGHRISLDDCENIIKRHFPIECACTGTDMKMIVCIVEEEYKDKVKTLLVKKTNLYATAIDVKIVDEIPRSSVGKILYAKLNELLD